MVRMCSETSQSQTEVLHEEKELGCRVKIE